MEEFRNYEKEVFEYLKEVEKQIFSETHRWEH